MPQHDMKKGRGAFLGMNDLSRRVRVLLQKDKYLFPVAFFQEDKKLGKIYIVFIVIVVRSIVRACGCFSDKSFQFRLRLIVIR